MTTRIVALVAFMLLPLLASCYRSTGGNLVTYGSNSHNTNCADAIQSATSRDADAQSVVDLLDEATVAARRLYDVSLTSVFMPSLVDRQYPPVFEFTAKDKPEVTVGFHAYTGEPKAIEGDPRGRAYSETELITLDDLMLGPSRALRALQQEYPTAEIGTLVLVREDCRLVWRARTVIQESQQKRVELHPQVDNATGQVAVRGR